MSLHAEATRANNFLAPRPSSIKIRSWRPFRNAAGSVRGFLSIELPSGLVINDSKMMVGSNAKPWIAMPAAKAIDRDGNEITNRDGKTVWNSFIEFTSREVRESFQQQVFAALQRQHPDAFDGLAL